MQIELIGCTGAGKSTLLRGILRACHEQGAEAFSGDDYVLAKVHLSWVRGYLIRTLLVDLFSLMTCLMTFRKNFSFYIWVTQKIFSLPISISWFQKINILRNTLKKIGIFEFVDQSNSGDQIILLDEGTLHTAHYLFVHLDIVLPETDLLEFAKLVPLPDAIIYLRQDNEILIERTLARGHKRIPTGSRLLVERFISRAIATFDKLAQVSAFAPRLFVVNSVQQITAPQNVQVNRIQAMTLNLLRAGLDSVNTEQSNKTHLS